MTTTFELLKRLPAKETFKFLCKVCEQTFEWSSTFIHPAFCPCCGTERQEAKFNRRYPVKSERA